MLCGISKPSYFESGEGVCCSFWFEGLILCELSSLTVSRLWSPLLDFMLEPLGLPVGSNKRQVARQAFEAVAHDVPGEELYKVLLADGTDTLVRFRPAT